MGMPQRGCRGGLCNIGIISQLNCRQHVGLTVSRDGQTVRLTVPRDGQTGRITVNRDVQTEGLTLSRDGQTVGLTIFGMDILCGSLSLRMDKL